MTTYTLRDDYTDTKAAGAVDNSAAAPGPGTRDVTDGSSLLSLAGNGYAYFVQGTISTYTYALAEVTKSGTGVYYKDVTVTTSGTWYYTWIGTGTVAAADEDEFVVLNTVFTT